MKDKNNQELSKLHKKKIIGESNLNLNQTKTKTVGTNKSTSKQKENKEIAQKNKQLCKEANEALLSKNNKIKISETTKNKIKEVKKTEKDDRMFSTDKQEDSIFKNYLNYSVLISKKQSNIKQRKSRVIIKDNSINTTLLYCSCLFKNNSVDIIIASFKYFSLNNKKNSIRLKDSFFNYYFSDEYKLSFYHVSNLTDNIINEALVFNLKLVYDKIEIWRKKFNTVYKEDLEVTLRDYCETCSEEEIKGANEISYNENNKNKRTFDLLGIIIYNDADNHSNNIEDVNYTELVDNKNNDYIKVYYNTHKKNINKINHENNLDNKANDNDNTDADNNYFYFNNCKNKYLITNINEKLSNSNNANISNSSNTNLTSNLNNPINNFLKKYESSRKNNNIYLNTKKKTTINIFEKINKTKLLLKKELLRIKSQDDCSILNTKNNIDKEDNHDSQVNEESFFSITKEQQIIIMKRINKIIKKMNQIIYNELLTLFFVVSEESYNQVNKFTLISDNNSNTKNICDNDLDYLHSTNDFYVYLNIFSNDIKLEYKSLIDIEYFKLNSLRLLAYINKFKYKYANITTKTNKTRNNSTAELEANDEYISLISSYLSDINDFQAINKLVYVEILKFFGSDFNKYMKMFLRSLRDNNCEDINDRTSHVCNNSLTNSLLVKQFYHSIIDNLSINVNYNKESDESTFPKTTSLSYLSYKLSNYNYSLKEILEILIPISSLPDRIKITNTKNNKSLIKSKTQNYSNKKTILTKTRLASIINNLNNNYINIDFYIISSTTKNIISTSKINKSNINNNDRFRYHELNLLEKKFKNKLINTNEFSSYNLNNKTIIEKIIEEIKEKTSLSNTKKTKIDKKVSVNLVLLGVNNDNDNRNNNSHSNNDNETSDSFLVFKNYKFFSINKKPYILINKFTILEYKVIDITKILNKIFLYYCSSNDSGCVNGDRFSNIFDSFKLTLLVEKDTINYFSLMLYSNYIRNDFLSSCYNRNDFFSCNSNVSNTRSYYYDLISKCVLPYSVCVDLINKFEFRYSNLSGLSEISITSLIMILENSIEYFYHSFYYKTNSNKDNTNIIENDKYYHDDSSVQFYFSNKNLLIEKLINMLIVINISGKCNDDTDSTKNINLNSKTILLIAILKYQYYINSNSNGNNTIIYNNIAKIFNSKMKEETLPMDFLFLVLKASLQLKLKLSNKINTSTDLFNTYYNTRISNINITSYLLITELFLNKLKFSFNSNRSYSSRLSFNLNSTDINTNTAPYQELFFKYFNKTYFLMIEVKEKIEYEDICANSFECFLLLLLLEYYSLYNDFKNMSVFDISQKIDNNNFNKIVSVDDNNEREYYNKIFIGVITSIINEISELDRMKAENEDNEKNYSILIKIDKFQEYYINNINKTSNTTNEDNNYNKNTNFLSLITIIEKKIELLLENKTNITSNTNNTNNTINPNNIIANQQEKLFSLFNNNFNVNIIMRLYNTTKKLHLHFLNLIYSNKALIKEEENNNNSSSNISDLSKIISNLNSITTKIKNSIKTYTSYNSITNSKALSLLLNYISEIDLISELKILYNENDLNNSLHLSIKSLYSFLPYNTDYIDLEHINEKISFDVERIVEPLVVNILSQITSLENIENLNDMDFIDEEIWKKEEIISELLVFKICDEIIENVCVEREDVVRTIRADAVGDLFKKEEDNADVIIKFDGDGDGEKGVVDENNKCNNENNNIEGINQDTKEKNNNGEVNNDTIILTDMREGDKDIKDTKENILTNESTVANNNNLNYLEINTSTTKNFDKEIQKIDFKPIEPLELQEQEEHDGHEEQDKDNSLCSIYNQSIIEKKTIFKENYKNALIPENINTENKDLQNTKINNKKDKDNIEDIDEECNIDHLLPISLEITKNSIIEILNQIKDFDLNDLRKKEEGFLKKFKSKITFNTKTFLDYYNLSTQIVDLLKPKKKILCSRNILLMYLNIGLLFKKANLISQSREFFLVALKIAKYIDKHSNNNSSNSNSSNNGYDGLNSYINPYRVPNYCFDMLLIENYCYDFFYFSIKIDLCCYLFIMISNSYVKEFLFDEALEYLYKGEAYCLSLSRNNSNYNENKENNGNLILIKLEIATVLLELNDFESINKSIDECFNVREILYQKLKFNSNSYLKVVSEYNSIERLEERIKNIFYRLLRDQGKNSNSSCNTKNINKDDAVKDIIYNIIDESVTIYSNKYQVETIIEEIINNVFKGGNADKDFIANTDDRNAAISQKELEIIEEIKEDSIDSIDNNNYSIGDNSVIKDNFVINAGIDKNNDKIIEENEYVSVNKKEIDDLIKGSSKIIESIINNTINVNSKDGNNEIENQEIPSTKQYEKNDSINNDYDNGNLKDTNPIIDKKSIKSNKEENNDNLIEVLKISKSLSSSIFNNNLANKATSNNNDNRLLLDKLKGLLLITKRIKASLKINSYINDLKSTSLIHVEIETLFLTAKAYLKLNYTTKSLEFINKAILILERFSYLVETVKKNTSIRSNYDLNYNDISLLSYYNTVIMRLKAKVYLLKGLVCKLNNEFGSAIENLQNSLSYSKLVEIYDDNNKVSDNKNGKERDNISLFSVKVILEIGKCYLFYNYCSKAGDYFHIAFKNLIINKRILSLMRESKEEKNEIVVPETSDNIDIDKNDNFKKELKTRLTLQSINDINIETEINNNNSNEDNADKHIIEINIQKISKELISPKELYYIIKTYLLLSQCYLNQDLLTLSEKYAYKALSTLYSNIDIVSFYPKQLKAKIFLTIAKIFIKKLAFDLSIDYYYKAFAEIKNNDLTKIAIIFEKIALNYYYKNNFHLSIEFLYKSLKYTTINDYASCVDIGRCFERIGDNYRTMYLILKYEDFIPNKKLVTTIRRFNFNMANNNDTNNPKNNKDEELAQNNNIINKEDDEVIKGNKDNKENKDTHSIDIDINKVSATVSKILSNSNSLSNEITHAIKNNISDNEKSNIILSPQVHQVKTLAKHEDTISSFFQKQLNFYFQSLVYYYKEYYSYSSKHLKISFNEDTNVNLRLTSLLSKIGDIYMDNKENELALEYYFKALKAFIKVGDDTQIEAAQLYYKISICYEELDDFYNGHIFLSKSNTIADIHSQVLNEDDVRVLVNLFEFNKFIGGEGKIINTEESCKEESKETNKCDDGEIRDKALVEETNTNSSNNRNNKNIEDTGKYYFNNSCTDAFGVFRLHKFKAILQRKKIAYLEKIYQYKKDLVTKKVIEENKESGENK